MTATTAPVLPSEMLALMRRGVSVLVGSRDDQMRPSLMRAMGSKVSADGAQVTVYLSRRQAGALLDGLVAGAPLSVVFSEPTQHRTVQLKASRAAAVRGAGEQDLPALQRYRAAMEYELEQVGMPRALTGAMLAFRLEDLAAVEMVPEVAFEQTPGPLAGRALTRQP